MRLRVLDASREFDVVHARLIVQPPAGVHLDDASGIAEAGWTVTRVGNGMAGDRQGLDPEERATIAAALPVDVTRMTDPVWQLDEERAGQFAAAFLSGGLFILIVGAGVLGIVRFEHPRGRTGDEAERRVVRRGLLLGGAACVLLSGAAAAATSLALGRYGPWPMAIPLSILVVGLLFAGFSRRIV